jgi:hypothetical protein
MEPGLIFLFIFFPFVLAAFIYAYHSSIRNRTNERDKWIDSVSIVEDHSTQIKPEMKLAIKSFSIENANELRGLDAGSLLKLLSCASAVLRCIENRITLISTTYNEYHYVLERPPNPRTTILDAPFIKRNRRELKEHEDMLKPVKERLDNQAERMSQEIEQEFLGAGSVLSIIPEKYRMSIILDKMCEYLQDGRVATWGDCIEKFIYDVNWLQQHENFQTMIGQLERIEHNTAMTKYFAGITAWNTR